MRFRSISPIIAIIVLIVITVGLAGLAYFFFSGTVSQMFITSTHKMQQTTGTIIQCSRVSGDISAHANSFRFRYRIPIIIQENSGNNLTNYQVNLIIDTASLISAGKMRSDCGDIRFTYVYPDGTEVKIPYWIEPNTCNTNSTKIWVKVPYIPANGNVTIYMYYGNPNALSESDADLVFTEIGTFYHTRYSTADPSSLEEGIYYFNLAQDTSGYCWKYITNYSNISNHYLTGCGGNYTNIAYWIEAVFYVDTEGMWDFRFGVDYGRGVDYI